MAANDAVSNAGAGAPMPPVGNGDTWPPKGASPKPKRHQSSRPNYAQLHARPLPLEVYPFPVFVPHNPLSLARIAIDLISHCFWPPESHPIIHKGVFSAETQSVHVTDWASVRALWEQGFWGSGSLSRTEPQWLDREKGKPQTAWAVTQDRRDQRRQFKLERARQQREAVEQQLRDEGKLAPTRSGEDTAPALYANNSSTTGAADDGTHLPPTRAPDSTPMPPKGTASSHPDADDSLVSFDVDDELENQEHLQLTPKEAFFLTYALGALEVFNHPSQTLLPASYLLRLYCTSSDDTTSDAAGQQLYAGSDAASLRVEKQPLVLDFATISPDCPFLLRYAVFHHFRSLGWVVKDGVKFSVDYLLYQRGPVFAHAQFGVMIIPSYSHPYWSETPERKARCDEKSGRDWWWLHRVNRVMTQAVKTLVLVYVEIPPPWDGLGAASSGENIGEVLKQYRVREFIFQRWSPNRNKD